MFSTLVVVLTAFFGSELVTAAEQDTTSSRIVFMKSTGGQSAPGANRAAGGWELVVRNADGSQRRLTHNDQQEFLPHFSPDGRYILFTRYAAGGYGMSGAAARVAVYDVATATLRDLTHTGKDAYPVWSPDGKQIAFLSSRDSRSNALWIMNADGSSAREVARPNGGNLDRSWGDIDWSSDNWILLVVAQMDANGGCFKTRIDKIRPDGSSRTQVTDGGPHCTPAGSEQSGDSDPDFSPDGSVIYTSRGYPRPVPGVPGSSVRKIMAVSSNAWYAGKPERDLSSSSRECVEGVPKASPDGKQLLVFRACAGEQPQTVLLDLDTLRRTPVVEGFGADWAP